VICINRYYSGTLSAPISWTKCLEKATKFKNKQLAKDYAFVNRLHPGTRSWYHEIKKVEITYNLID